jgi:beta-galactosidase
MEASMKKINFDLDWQFSLGNSLKKKVNLPHDFSVELPRKADSLMAAHGGYFRGGDCEYKKMLPSGLEGRVVLEVEGAYMNAEVFVNENLVAKHPYGYTSFHVELTDWLKKDSENELKILIRNNALPNSRWYTGSGLYRHVWLLTANGPHIAPWGVYVTTPAAVAKQAVVKVETEVVGDGLLCHKLQDAQGRVVASAESHVTSGKVVQELTVNAACLWQPDAPYLYTLISSVSSGGTVTDEVKTTVGIRSIALDPERGFLLNGVPIKLKGGCVHHDNGILGAASWDAAEERKAASHKAAGFNAIRCAHNPPSPAFLDACDRLGLIVMDEAFDCWRVGKVPYDYHLYFEDWWLRDIDSMVRRDRNHPCIVFWSTGNEVPERFGKSGGNELSLKLASAIRSLDNTRFISNALTFAYDQEIEDFAKDSEKFAEPLDVVGYNYLWERYEEDLSAFPNRFIYGTETYPAQAFENWNIALKNPRVLGDCVWTSMDYIGEAGIGKSILPGESPAYQSAEYPWLLSNCGDLDIMGRPKPQSIYRQILWGSITKPWIAVHRPNEKGLKTEGSYWGWPDVHHSWSWPGAEGSIIYIDIYCNADEVELFVNDRSLGKKTAGKSVRNIASFETVYEPGCIRAVSYVDGKAVEEDSICTCGEPYAIRLETDKSEISHQWGGLAFVTAAVVDKQGNTVPWANNELFFAVHGAGALQAAGTRDPKPEEPFTGNRHSAYEGSVVAAVRSSGEPGEITLTVSAEGLKPASISIIAK